MTELCTECHTRLGRVWFYSNDADDKICRLCYGDDATTHEVIFKDDDIRVIAMRVYRSELDDLFPAHCPDDRAERKLTIAATISLVCASLIALACVVVTLVKI